MLPGVSKFNVNSDGLSLCSIADLLWTSSFHPFRFINGLQTYFNDVMDQNKQLMTSKTTITKWDLTEPVGVPEINVIDMLHLIVTPTHCVIVLMCLHVPWVIFSVWKITEPNLD